MIKIVDIKEGLEEELINVLELYNCKYCGSKDFIIDFEKIIGGNAVVTMNEDKIDEISSEEEEPEENSINIKEVKCRNCKRVLYSKDKKIVDSIIPEKENE